MRRDSVAPDLQPCLVPVEGRSHVVAMRPPPVPRSHLKGSGFTALGHEAAGALGRLQGAIAHWHTPDLLTRTLARREAVQSSQIEGTKTDLGELLTYEATHNAEGLPADVRVTQQYVHALQIGLDAVRERGRKALTLGLIDCMHAELMTHEDPGIAKGRYRSGYAWIGSGRIEDASFVPSPPSDILAGMQALEADMLQYRPRENEAGALSLIAQIAIAHAQFETIHPYVDGNGRVGRLLMPLMLAAEGHPALYLSGSLMRQRARYYAALNQVQVKGDWTQWMQMLYRAVIESADEAIAVASDLNALVARWAAEVSCFRSGSVARRLPPLLIGHPVLTAAQVTDLLQVTHKTALTGIDHLLGVGILAPKDARKWGRVYQAEAVLARLNQAPVASRQESSR